MNNHNCTNSCTFHNCNI